MDVDMDVVVAMVERVVVALGGWYMRQQIVFG